LISRSRSWGNEEGSFKNLDVKWDFQRITSWILKGVIAIDLVCIALLISGWGWRYMTSLNNLSLREIRVSGLHVMGKEELRRLAGVRWGENLLKIDVKRVCNNIKRDPWIADVAVKKVFPDKVDIKVEERKPIAAIDMGRYFYLMDIKGEVFLRLNDEEAKGYLIIKGLREEDLEKDDQTVQRFIWDAIALFPLLVERGLEDFDCIEINRYSGLTLISRSRGISVNIGQEEFERRLDRLRTILGLNSHQRFKQIVSIDLSFPNQAIIRINQQEKESQVCWGKG
jgi:cell division protein FtsQ